MSKVFESKTAQHIYSYDLVKWVVDYSLSFSIINYITSYLAAAYDYLNQYILTPYFATWLTYIDSQLNSLLTDYFDALVLPLLLSYYQSVVALINYPLEHYLKPINDYSLQYLQTLFPNEKFPVENVNELSKSVIIANEFLSNVYKTLVSTSYNVSNQVKSKTNEFTNSVVETYNQEVSSVKDTNIVTKNITASYNTATTTYENYIKPLQQQTTELVVDGKKKASDLINDVTNQTKSKATDLINDGKKRASEFVNVSASVAKPQETTTEVVEEKVNGVVSAEA